MLTQINKNFKNKDIVSIDQFDIPSIELVFKQVEKIKKTSANKLLTVLKGKIATLIFFEPSSRTFSSHAAAMKRLGGQTIEYQNPLQTSSAIKGETIEDSMKVFSQYSDVIVIRHPQIGTAEAAANAVDIPVVNAGDGAGEHPTQALLDMYTIKEKTKTLNNLIGLISGDFRYGRALRSLLKGLSLYKNNTLYLLSPKEFSLTQEDKNMYEQRGLKFVEIQSEKEIPKNCHFWYWTRVQKERFTTFGDSKVTKMNILTTKLLEEKGNKNMIIMHVLPRIDEVERAVDDDSRSIYLNKQVKNGMYIRMALLSLILGKKV
jgi:aspartate carbamoyltransferase catalytic subunit